MSIRWGLFLALSGLVALVTVVLVAFSSADQARASAEFSRQIIGRAQQSADARLARLVDPIRSALLVHCRQVWGGQLERYDDESVVQHVLPMIRDLPSVGSAMVGDGEGSQLLVMRYDEHVLRSPLLEGQRGLPELRPDVQQYFTREFRRREWGDRSEWILWDEAGTRPLARWSRELPDYDPAQRPWSTRAIARLREVEARGGSSNPEDFVTWTDVYTLFTTRAPGISASLAARGPDGRVTVVAYDVLLDELSRYTRAEQPTPRGTVFAFDDEGRIFGLPRDERFDGEAARLAAFLQPLEDVTSPPLRDWQRAWASAASPAATPFVFTADGEAWWGSARATELGPEHRLWIGIALPQSDVLALTAGAPSDVWWVGGIGLLLAFVLSMWVARAIARPLAALADESRRIGSLELAARPLPRSMLTEVQTLSTSLYAMRQALAQHVEALDSARREREEAEERYRATFEQAAVGIAHVGVDGRLQFCNDQFCSMLGRSREALIGASVIDLTHVEHRASDAQRLERLLAREAASEQWEKRMVRGDGSTVWVSVAVKLCTDAGGNSPYFLSIAKDISARKSLEQRLVQSQKMDAVGRLAGGLAHDFNNVLTAILGYADLARTSLADTSLARRYLEEVTSAAEGAARLIRQVMTFARHEVAPAAACDVERVARDSERLLVQLVGPDVELSIQAVDRQHLVGIDAVQMQQILINLAVNARDAMPAGGRLTIRIARAAADVSITVSDTGSGMDEDVRTRLFEPFFTTKEVGKGTGLGLAVCYGIVQSAQGTIEVDSAPGRGATFRLRLPALRAPLPAPQVPETPAEVSSGQSVLVVDDDDRVRDLVESTLEACGYRVLVASGAEPALDIVARGESIDLLLTDVVMPGCDGGALADRVRAELPGLPVLFMTGFSRGGLRRPRGEAVLAKPFGPEGLVNAVRAALDPRARERPREPLPGA